MINANLINRMAFNFINESRLIIRELDGINKMNILGGLNPFALVSVKRD